MGQNKLITAKRLESYFYDQIREACSNQKINPSEHTEFYLVKMLSDYAHREVLQAGGLEERPLALQYLESLTADPREAFVSLKQLGDFSLYISGFFQESLQRKNVGLDYYINMGGNAYERLHAMIQSSRLGETFQDTFWELGQKFTMFMDVLSEISEKCQLAQSNDPLSLYEKWLQSGSHRIYEKLRELGMDPGFCDPSNQSH